MRVFFLLSCAVCLVVARPQDGYNYPQQPLGLQYSSGGAPPEQHIPFRSYGPLPTLPSMQSFFVHESHGSAQTNQNLAQQFASQYAQPSFTSSGFIGLHQAPQLQQQQHQQQHQHQQQQPQPQSFAQNQFQASNIASASSDAPQFQQAAQTQTMTTLSAPAPTQSALSDTFGPSPVDIAPSLNAKAKAAAEKAAKAAQEKSASQSTASNAIISPSQEEASLNFAHASSSNQQQFSFQQQQPQPQQQQQQQPQQQQQQQPQQQIQQQVQPQPQITYQQYSQITPQMQFASQFAQPAAPQFSQVSPLQFAQQPAASIQSQQNTFSSSQQLAPSYASLQQQQPPQQQQFTFQQFAQSAAPVSAPQPDQLQFAQFATAPSAPSAPSAPAASLHFVPQQTQLPPTESGIDQSTFTQFASNSVEVEPISQAAPSFAQFAQQPQQQFAFQFEQPAAPAPSSNQLQFAQFLTAPSAPAAPSAPVAPSAPESPSTPAVPSAPEAPRASQQVQAAPLQSDQFPISQTTSSQSVAQSHHTSNLHQSNLASSTNDHPNYADEARKVQQTTTIHKHVYVHVPPPDFEEPEPQPRNAPSTVNSQKHVQILFIKAPAPPAQRLVDPALLPQNEEKTLVYVLVKKPEQINEIAPSQLPEAKVNKPEVYFIKYDTKKEAEANGHLHDAPNTSETQQTGTNGLDTNIISPTVSLDAEKPKSEPIQNGPQSHEQVPLISDGSNNPNLSIQQLPFSQSSSTPSNKYLPA